MRGDETLSGSRRERPVTEIIDRRQQAVMRAGIVGRRPVRPTGQYLESLQRFPS
jgi:hypothetical protein